MEYKQLIKIDNIYKNAVNELIHHSTNQIYVIHKNGKIPVFLNFKKYDGEIFFLPNYEINKFNEIGRKKINNISEKSESNGDDVGLWFKYNETWSTEDFKYEIKTVQKEYAKLLLFVVRCSHYLSDLTKMNEQKLLCTLKLSLQCDKILNDHYLNRINSIINDCDFSVPYSVYDEITYSDERCGKLKIVENKINIYRCNKCVFNLEFDIMTLKKNITNSIDKITDFKINDKVKFLLYIRIAIKIKEMIIKEEIINLIEPRINDLIEQSRDIIADSDLDDHELFFSTFCDELEKIMKYYNHIRNIRNVELKKRFKKLNTEPIPNI